MNVPRQTNNRMKICDDNRASIAEALSAATAAPPLLTYARSSDALVTRWLIRRFEHLSGVSRLQCMYDEIYRDQVVGPQLWRAALDKLQITVDYDAAALDDVPRSGPIVFVANHPFGIVDGLIMCFLISQVREDFFLLVNAAVLPQPLIERYLLPIDFKATKAALKTNLSTKHLTTQRLRQGHALGIFPAGMVATAQTPWGPAREMPWHTFVSRRIHEARSAPWYRSIFTARIVVGFS